MGNSSLQVVRGLNFLQVVKEVAAKDQNLPVPSAATGEFPDHVCYSLHMVMISGAVCRSDKGCVEVLHHFVSSPVTDIHVGVC